MSSIVGKERKSLRLALADAFPTYEALRRMGRDQLNFDLNKKTHPNAGIINAAEVLIDEMDQAQGRLGVVRLIEAARADRPSNPTLRAVEQLFMQTADPLGDVHPTDAVAPTVATRAGLERVIVESAGFPLFSEVINHLGQAEYRVCTIAYTRADQCRVYGTGFLVGDDLVMTNCHVIAAAKNALKGSRVELTFGYRSKESQVTRYTLVEDSWLVTSDEAYDYAILRVQGAPGSDSVVEKGEMTRGFFRLVTYSPAENEPLLILQHPYDVLADRPAPLRITIGFVHRAQTGQAEHVIRHSANTSEGASGSPVFSGRMELIALHNWGGQKHNEAIRIGAIKKHLEATNFRNLVGVSGPPHLRVLVDSKCVRPDNAGIEPAPTLQTPRPTRLVGPIKISQGYLPGGGEYFVGREIELSRLDAAWDDPGTHIISVVGWGGAGKSALVDQWLVRLKRDRFRGAEYVFGWSFNNQGNDQREDAADAFIAAALRECGDLNWASGTTTEKAARLTDRLQQRQILLILDGLESLQSPPGGPTSGELKDPVLRKMLRELQVENAGLCVISTRLAVRDLASWRDSTAPVLDLPELTPELGADLLMRLGVRGKQEELRQATLDFSGHALALTLLGTFLRDAHGGNIARRRDVMLVDAGGQAESILRSYESWFQSEGRLVQLAILRLLGLFDRPARQEDIAALLQKPPIADLTIDLDGISDIEWNRCVASLRKARLLSAEKDGERETLDAHPLVREYFGRRLQSSSKSAWSEGHSRLFDFLARSVPPIPTKLHDILTLHSAIAHGCSAGRHEDTLAVYWKRVLQKNKYFSIKVLGALASDTAALSCFFEGSWDKPSPQLSAKGRSRVLGQAGEALHALGRLNDAWKPMHLLFTESSKCNDLDEMGKTAITLSELHLTKGDLERALHFAAESVKLADRRKHPFHQMVSRSIAGDALHYLGRFHEAEASFIEAEAFERVRRPDRPLLSSMQGYSYCDVLISLGRGKEAEQRASQTIQWARDTLSLLAEGLGHLTLGRVLCIRGSNHLANAEKELEAALTLLKRAGAEFRIPIALLAFAELRLSMGQLGTAREYLNEALAVATQSGMRLVEADCHLGLSRVTLAGGIWDEARHHYDSASSLISEMGYARRGLELDQLKKLLE